MLFLTKIGFLLVAYQITLIQCTCPIVKPAENADAWKYADGFWGDVAVTHNTMPDGEILSNLIYQHVGNLVTYRSEDANGPEYVVGTGRIVSPGTLQFSFSVEDNISQNADMTLVYQDDDIVVQYGCVKADNKSEGITWISTRQKNPDERVTAKVHKFMDSYIDPNTNQKATWKSRI